MKGVLPDQREVLFPAIDIPQGVLQERESQYSYLFLHDEIRREVRLVFWPPWLLHADSACVGKSHRGVTAWIYH